MVKCTILSRVIYNFLDLIIHFVLVMFNLFYFISSDDEIDILLHGTPEQKRKLQNPSSMGKEALSSEDEFEKEMNAELNGRVKELERRRGSVSGRHFSRILSQEHKSMAIDICPFRLTYLNLKLKTKVGSGTFTRIRYFRIAM